MSFLSILFWTCVIFIFLFFLKKYFNGPKTSLTKDMTDKIIIVTGSSAGIGKELANELLKNGAKVIYACRDERRTLAVINKLENPKMRENAYFIKLDLANFESIINFVI